MDWVWPGGVRVTPREEEIGLDLAQVGKRRTASQSRNRQPTPFFFSIIWFRLIQYCKGVLLRYGDSNLERASIRPLDGIINLVGI